MKKILNPAWRLRGWQDRRYVLERFPDRTLKTLTLPEFLYLLRCDGYTEIDPDGWPAEQE